MYKSKTRERKLFISRKHSRRRRSGLVVIVSVVLLLLILELLTRIFLDLSGNKSQFAQANSKSDLSQAYRLQFVAEDIAPDSIGESIALKARPSLSFGYQLLGNQDNPYYQINAQGFRDRDPIPLVKSPGEIRVFLLGNSTAFGYGVNGNQATISDYLEQRLQQRLQQQKTSPALYKPDLLPSDLTEKQKYLAKPSKIKPGNYRVINASVPGYASGNELAQIALDILKYKPDLIVILDGYEDLMLPSNLKTVPTPSIDQIKDNKPTSFTDYLTQIVEPIENKSYLAKMAQERWLKSSSTNKIENFILNESTSQLVQHLPSNQAELDQRVKRYIEHQQQILSLSTAAQVPLIVAIQPEITGRNPSQLTPQESQIVTDLGRTYIKQVQENYPVLIEATEELAKAFPHNLKAVDLYRLSEKYPAPSFIDPIHLTESANQKVAEQLYYAISSLPKMQLQPKVSEPSQFTQ